MNFLPGWMPDITDAALDPLTLSFIGSNSSSGNDTITLPGGSAIGDLVVAFNCDYGEDFMPDTTLPAGFSFLATTTIGNGSNDSWKATSGYRILDSTATLTNFMDAEDSRIVILVFRGSRSIISVTPSSWNGQSTTGNATSQTVSASGQSTPLLVIGCAGSINSATTFSTASPAFDAQVVGPDSDQRMGYNIYNTTPANHSIDINDLGNDNHLHSGYLICAG